MTKATHTKAPWKRMEHNWRETTIFSKDSGKIICRMDLYDWDEVSEEDQHLCEAEQKANALLIEAAPDLLVACKMQQKLINDMIRFVGQMALQDYALLNEAPIAATKAIAKAEG